MDARRSSISTNKIIINYTIFLLLYSIIIALGLDITSGIKDGESVATLTKNALTAIPYSLVVFAPYLLLILYAYFRQNKTNASGGFMIATIFTVPVGIYVGIRLMIDNLLYQTPDAGYGLLLLVFYCWPVAILGYVAGTFFIKRKAGR